MSVRILAGMCLLASVAACAVAQDEGDLTAKRRILQEIGPGLRAVRRGGEGNLYVLTGSSSSVSVFDAAGKLVKQVPPQGAAKGPQAESAAIRFGEDMDVDAAGAVYVADRGANFIRVFSAEGTLLRAIAVKNPVAVAALPDDEIAVATLRDPHLVLVFDKNGREVREFGNPEPIADRADLNRFLNTGLLGNDGDGYLYYAFSYMPEPTVRQFDRYGYGGQDIQYTALEAYPAAQAARREIQRQEKRGDTPSFKRIITALGVDHSSDEVWIALYNTLLHFDKEGTRRGTYKLYTPEGARLEATTILVEKERLIIGSDPRGVFEFERPGKKNI